MEEKIFNKKAVIDYLLGALPEEETERFDELSFTDDDFAHILKVVEDELIDSYIANELSGATLEKFKVYYLASPLRREKVKFAESLQIYAERNIAQPISDKTGFFETPKREGFFAFWNIFANPAFRWVSVAVVLAIASFGGFWIINKRLNKPENDVAVKQETPAISNVETPKLIDNNSPSARNEPANKKAEPQKEIAQKTPVVEPSRTPKIKEAITVAPIIASFVLAPPLRGSNQLQTISFSKQTTVIKMELKLEGNDFKTYRAVLVDESNKSLRRSGNIKSRAEAVNVSFPANLLKPGIYSLILSGVNDDSEAEIINNYSFRSVLK